MSVAKRAYYHQINKLSKQLKRPLQLVADMMPIGFSDEDYFQTFKLCFAGLWQSLIAKKRIYDMMDRERLRKHIKPIYFFPEPSDLLLRNSISIRNRTRNSHNQGVVKNEKERAALRKKYELTSKKREIVKVRKKKKNEELQQNVKPSFSNYFIKTYFNIKHTHPEDVNSRMRILEEAAKFKCPETISFMFKVNSAERNYHLRFFAFQTLQKQFGFPEVHLHRNRKGKPHPGDKTKPKKMDTPKLLMDEILQSEYDLEKNKRFDVFISHSTKDYKTIIKLKTMLNRQGLSVYIDWIEDRESLRREMTSKETAQAISQRIIHSRSMLVVFSESSLSSTWVPWEIGFAQALGKNVCLLKLEIVENVPEYLEIFHDAMIEDEIIVVKDGIRKMPIERWIVDKNDENSHYPL